ncbi:hypothetical protein ACTIVE_5107 [Actinomadura verrucosospora]|uniref:Uncharacterized protein n=1 Tax=Actinomadura verrucosospora TaxID=46165 RepID=A0A7D4A1K4_ACTVE|nr:hypothetical protein ACTIVE_5107 [Actinomadura verrucosospora]
MDDQAIIELAVRLRDLRWPWSASGVPTVARALGWTVDSASEGIIELDTGLGPSSGSVELDWEGTVNTVRVLVTSFIDSDEAAERAWLRDAFVHATGLLTAALGDPTQRIPGSSPQVRWRGPDSTVGLSSASVSLVIFSAGNHYLDEDDLRGQRGSA